MGTQNTRLNEDVLLNTQNICLNCWVKITLYAHKCCSLTLPMNNYGDGVVNIKGNKQENMVAYNII